MWYDSGTSSTTWGTVCRTWQSSERLLLTLPWSSRSGGKTVASRAKGGRNPVQFRRSGDQLTLTADLEALGTSHVVIECKQNEFRLTSKSDVFRISLLFFDVATEFIKRHVAFTVTPRSEASLVSLLSSRCDWPGAGRGLLPSVMGLFEAAQETKLTGALVARLIKAFADVTADVDDAIAADAVSESSDVLAFVRLLEQPDVLEKLKAVDPLAPARLRGIKARQTLLDLAGGTLSSEEVASALGLTRQAIEKRRRAGRLLALSFGKRGYRYPAFQFADGKSLPGLEPVLEAMKQQDAWTQLAFFVNRRSDLGQKAPAALLAKGAGDRVLSAADTVGEQGAA